MVRVDVKRERGRATRESMRIDRVEPQPGVGADASVRLPVQYLGLHMIPSLVVVVRWRLGRDVVLRRMNDAGVGAPIADSGRV